MIFHIKGEDTRQRYWMPNKVIRVILEELLEDFVGIKITEFSIVRNAAGEDPESKEEDWS